MGKSEYFVPLDGRLRNVLQSYSWAETQRPHAVRGGEGGDLEPEGGGALRRPHWGKFYYVPLLLCINYPPDLVIW